MPNARKKPGYTKKDLREVFLILKCALLRLKG